MFYCGSDLNFFGKVSITISEKILAVTIFMWI